MAQFDNSKIDQDLTRIIEEIRVNYGQAILRDGTLLTAYFCDLAPRLKKERILLEALIAINGNENLVDVVCASVDEQYRVLSNTVLSLNTQRGISVDVATDFCNLFFKGIGGVAQYKPVQSTKNEVRKQPINST